MYNKGKFSTYTLPLNFTIERVTEVQKHISNVYFFFQDDIEKIVAQIELEERKQQEVVEIIVPPPSRRANFTLTAHPDKEELILLGGEYFNGKKVHYYNSLTKLLYLNNTAIPVTSVICEIFCVYQKRILIVFQACILYLIKYKELLGQKCVNTFPTFMKSKVLSPCSQKPTTGPCSVPV